jgi:hypothetical protein
VLKIELPRQPLTPSSAVRARTRRLQTQLTLRLRATHPRATILNRLFQAGSKGEASVSAVWLRMKLDSARMAGSWANTADAAKVVRVG